MSPSRLNRSRKSFQGSKGSTKSSGASSDPKSSRPHPPARNKHRGAIRCVRHLSDTLRLRERDFTRNGHLSQSACHELLSEARRLLLREVNCQGQFILRHSELEHVAEVGAEHESIEATVAVIRIGISSATLSQALRTGTGRVAAQGEFVVVAWDGLVHRKRPLTALEIERLSTSEKDLS